MMPIFKSCPSCHKDWETQDSFITDAEVELNGYTADFEELTEGLFFFTHNQENCCSTMAIAVKDFMNLYDGPFYSERKTGHEDCPEYCLKKDQLDRCDLHCECAYVREIIQILKDRHDSKLSQ